MRPPKLPSRVLAALAVLLGLAGGAGAASVAKTYSYFSVGGATLDEIQAELARHGPHVSSTGRRHPGATTMQFKTRLTFAERSGSCSVAKADVSVRAKVTLPSWRRPKRAQSATRLIWDTLAADIKRHEERHIGIARNAARGMEAAMGRLGRFPDCAAASAAAKALSAKLLARHDEEQLRFDRVEGVNFESRILRLLQYRLAQAKAAASD